MIQRSDSSPGSHKHRQLTFDDPQEFTLRQAYEKYHRQPDHKPRYVAEVHTSLGHWERCTPNPPICEIDNQMMAAFRQSFLSTPLPSKVQRLFHAAKRKDAQALVNLKLLGLTWKSWSKLNEDRRYADLCQSYSALASPPTAIQALVPSPASFETQRRQLEAILATIGPKRHGKPFALGLIDDMPRAQPAKTSEPEPITATPEEVSAIYQRCDVATWPAREVTGIDPPLLWRGLVVFLFNVGSRRKDFLLLKKSQIDFVRKGLRQKQDKTGKVRLLPLNDTVLRHLQMIWDHQSEFVFPLTYGKDSYKSFYAQWRTIQRAAGIHVDRSDFSSRHDVYGFHELRKTCLSEFFAVNEQAAQQMGAHGQLLTTIRHYVSASRKEGIARQAADQIPQPTAFLPPEPEPPTEPPVPGRPRLRVVG